MLQLDGTLIYKHLQTLDLNNLMWELKLQTHDDVFGGIGPLICEWHFSYNRKKQQRVGGKETERAVNIIFKMGKMGH